MYHLFSFWKSSIPLFSRNVLFSFRDEADRLDILKEHHVSLTSVCLSLKRGQFNFLLYGPDQTYFLTNQNNNNTDFTYKDFFFITFYISSSMISFF